MHLRTTIVRILKPGTTMSGLFIGSLMFAVAALLAATGCRMPQATAGAAAATADRETVTLVRNGEARAIVVAPEDRSPLQHDGVDGVDELVEHIRLISGVELSVVTDPNEIPDGMLPINLCRQADAALDDAIRAADGLDDAFALRARRPGGRGRRIA